jgi:pimeloyl-ACP methyl ester carboxylesterase
MKGCKEKIGDLPRYLSTAFVARDVDAIRKALGEEKLTAYMVSYGTGIGE